MEAGSLLQEALSRQAERDIFDSGQALWLDVFLLRDDTTDKIQHFLELAQLASELNCFFQSQKYPWHIGGDGPVFGIHTSDKVPHLRAICRYGANVADEWISVHFMTQFTAGKADIAAEVFDVQDGQILLIESADSLPKWVDQIGPENCRHRCWIHKGKIQLIEPNLAQFTDSHRNFLELRPALEILRTQNDNNASSTVVTPDNVQGLIQNCILRLASPGKIEKDASLSEGNTQDFHYHRAALTVPRAVAYLFERRPDLINAAIVAFANLAQEEPIPLKREKKTPRKANNNVIVCEDWVWTTRSFSRTNYAMLRTIVSPIWNSEDYIPPEYKSLELKRIERQCKVEATPHIRNALQLGVRLVAGLEALLQQSSAQPPMSALSLKEQRVLQGWSRVSQEVDLSPQWLVKAWQAGPNHAADNLEYILQCPVFHEELELNPHNITPLSHPETPLKRQITKELNREFPEKDFLMPHQEEVDKNEDWMTLSMDQADEEMRRVRGQVTQPEGKQSVPGTKQADQLDAILDGFETFMVEKSDVEGVAHRSPEATTEEGGVRINPRVFLNLLQAVLDPTTSVEAIPVGVTQSTGAPEEDEFFSKGDYEDMLPNDDDDGSDDNGNDQLDTDVVELMNAMDHELKGTAAMQNKSTDVLGESGIQGGEHDTEVEEHARILSNLLQSLDAGAGGPGPVQSMLRAMGQEPLLLSSDHTSAGDGDEEE